MHGASLFLLVAKRGTTFAVVRPFLLYTDYIVVPKVPADSRNARKTYCVTKKYSNKMWSSDQPLTIWK